MGQKCGIFGNMISLVVIEEQNIKIQDFEIMHFFPYKIKFDHIFC